MQVNSSGRILAVVQSPENRLGRWSVCKKIKSKILLWKIYVVDVVIHVVVGIAVA